jgi:UDP-N-acetylmuramate--alanine ligase
MSQIRDIQAYSAVYFLGIGGIGMSALARYFKLLGKTVGGYDKTPSPLTDTLTEEGIFIHFEDLGNEIPTPFNNPETCLVIYTPAIPNQLKELNYIKENNFDLLKRSEALGFITRSSKGLGVAGTHGKTTTSTLLAHILNESIGCSAFLGGIASNFNSNFVFSEQSPYTVIEADEFDRSFLRLNPFASIVTSTDADHLDIYGDASKFLEGFQNYVDLIDPAGILVVKKGLKLERQAPILTYAIEEEADYTGKNLRVENGVFYMDVQTPNAFWNEVALGLPGIHNAENALACLALCEFLKLDEHQIRHGLASFKGVKRRFEYHIRTEKLVYIDDYAHHPTEIRALLNSVRLVYPTKKVTGIFQPHLFSRTQDFMNDFAAELSHLDELILMPIYPAREEAIPGVTSEVLLAKCTAQQQSIKAPEEIVNYLSSFSEGVVLTIGAGDIDRIVPSVKSILLQHIDA